MIFMLNGVEAMRINRNNMLSIERQRKELQKFNSDSTYYADNEHDLFNVALWNKLNEKIMSGPQAISLDVSYP